MDRDLNRLAAAASIVMLAVLFFIACVSIRPYNLIEQEHTVYAGSGQVTAFTHPVLRPATSDSDGSGPVKTALGETLTISPYDHDSGTSWWVCPGTGEQGRYVCQVRWTAGYSVYVAGIDIFDGNAPWTARNLTLIDAPGKADGQPNMLHMSDTVRLDGSTDMLPTDSPPG